MEKEQATVTSPAVYPTVVAVQLSKGGKPEEIRVYQHAVTE